MAKKAATTDYSNHNNCRRLGWPKETQQKAIITIGKPISVSERYADYKSDRRSAVAQLTQDLQTSLESLIIHQ